jgi:hypothetical protein
MLLYVVSKLTVQYQRNATDTVNKILKEAALASTSVSPSFLLPPILSSGVFVSALLRPWQCFLEVKELVILLLAVYCVLRLVCNMFR